MKHQLSSESGQQLPFLLQFAEQIDSALHVAAIAESEMLEKAYDPTSQTSIIPMQAGKKGTSLTYRTTYCGIAYPSDQKQSDT